MPARKLKPIEERDPYAALVIAAFNELEERERKANHGCECCNGTGKIRETEFIDGDYSACMTCNGSGI